MCKWLPQNQDQPFYNSHKCKTICINLRLVCASKRLFDGNNRKSRLKCPYKIIMSRKRKRKGTVPFAKTCCSPKMSIVVINRGHFLLLKRAENFVVHQNSLRGSTVQWWQTTPLSSNASTPSESRIRKRKHNLHATVALCQEG